MLPKQKNQITGYNNINLNNDDEIDALIKPIDDMQSVINGKKIKLKIKIKI